MGSLVSATKQAPSTFENLIKALKDQGLWDKLGGAGPYTIFAPDDFAFERQGVTAADADAKLFIYEGKMTLREFKNQMVPTLGGDVQMKKGREWVKMNKHAIKKPNVELTNGMLHLMDGVPTER